MILIFVLVCLPISNSSFQRLLSLILLLIFVAYMTLTVLKMKKDGATVSSDVLVKICTALECTMDDIVEIIPFDN